MARSLAELQKQYNSAQGPMSLRGGPGGGPPRGRMAKGKPKELGKTVKRILSYVGKYKLRLIFVFVCMLFTTVSSLLGGYMIAPIINRLSSALGIVKDQEPSAVENFADGIIYVFRSGFLIIKNLCFNKSLCFCIFRKQSVVIHRLTAVFRSDS